MSLLRGVQRLALGLGVVAAAAAAGGLFLPRRIVSPLFGPASPPPTTRPRPHDPSLLRDLKGSGIQGINDDIICGGIDDAPGLEKDPDAIELARFAVAEHDSKTNAALEFVRLVKVRHQVVEGSMYYFTVEVREVDGGAIKLYEAEVWLRPWLKFKRLEAFELVANASNADEGTKMKI